MYLTYFHFQFEATIDQVCEAVNTKVKLDFEGASAFLNITKMTISVYSCVYIYDWYKTQSLEMNLMALSMKYINVSFTVFDLSKIGTDFLSDAYTFF